MYVLRRHHHKHSWKFKIMALFSRPISIIKHVSFAKNIFFSRAHSYRFYYFLDDGLVHNKQAHKSRLYACLARFKMWNVMEWMDRIKWYKKSLHIRLFLLYSRKRSFWRVWKFLATRKIKYGGEGWEWMRILHSRRFFFGHLF